MILENPHLSRNSNKTTIEMTTSTSFFFSAESTSPTAALRKHREEEFQGEEWQKHKKHFLILSSAGKPIYSRYGDEGTLSSLMGVIQAFLSVFMLQDHDELQFIKSGSYLYVFYTQGPLYYVAVSKKGESIDSLLSQLKMLHSCILFTLTLPQITSIFDRHSNFDLRSLMGGTDILLDKLSKYFNDPWIWLEAMPCVKINPISRKLLKKSWKTTQKCLPKSIVFSLLVANKRILSLVQPTKHTLEAKDAALVINMVYSSRSFKSQETWTPACLPLFNSSGFLYCYVSFISADICLINLSVDRDSFFAQSAFKESLLESLSATSKLESINEEAQCKPLSVIELGLPGVRHCLVKLGSIYYEMTPVAPYNRKQERKRLLRLYQEAGSRIEGSRTATNGYISYQVTTAESVLVQKTPFCEYYLALSPLSTKEAAVACLGRVTEYFKANMEAFQILL